MHAPTFILGSYFQHIEVQAFNISRFRHITLHLCEGIWLSRLGNANKNDVDFVIAYLYFGWYFIGLSIIFKFKSQVRNSISDNVTIYCVKSHSNPTKISKLLQGLRDLFRGLFFTFHEAIKVSAGFLGFTYHLLL